MNISQMSTLSSWFGLSYASFLVLHRVLMQQMPAEWQEKMAALLKEYDAEFPNLPEYETRVQCVKNGRLAVWPEWMLNYRHPDQNEIEKARAGK